MKILKKRRVIILFVSIITLMIIGVYLGMNTFRKSNDGKPDRGLRGSDIEHDIPLGFEHYNDQPKSNKNLYIEPVKVKGIYVSGWTAGTKARADELIEKINSTELNTMVIDVKEDKGKITYGNNNETAKEVGAIVNAIGNIDELIKRLRENKIFPIARVVAFKDPVAAENRPDLAIKMQMAAFGVIIKDLHGLIHIIKNLGNT